MLTGEHSNKEWCGFGISQLLRFRRCREVCKPSHVPVSLSLVSSGRNRLWILPISQVWLLKAPFPPIEAALLGPLMSQSPSRIPLSFICGSEVLKWRCKLRDETGASGCLSTACGIRPILYRGSAAYRLLRLWPGKPLIDAETGGELIDAEVLGMGSQEKGSNSRAFVRLTHALTHLIIHPLAQA